MRNISATNVKLPVDASDLGIFGTFKSHCIQMHHHRHELQIQAARLMVERWVCYLRVLMVWKKNEGEQVLIHQPGYTEFCLDGRMKC